MAGAPGLTGPSSTGEQKMARGIALLVGLTSVDPAKYEGWDGVSGAKGCEYDVDNMAKVISSADKYEKITILKTQLATRSEILACIESASDILTSGDMFVFYYTGHGGQVKDADCDEVDGQDETLCAYDGEIPDDELAKRWLKFAPGVRIVMLSDSCNSGTNEGYITKVMGAKPPKQPIRELNPISLAGKLTGMDAQLIHFGACEDGKTSDGGLSGSAFTLALVKVWKNKKGAFPGYEQLHEAIKARLKKERYPQEPQFSCFEVQPEFLNSRPFSLS